METELIQEGVKFKIAATKTGLSRYFLTMNGSFLEVDVHRLSDGGKDMLPNLHIVVYLKTILLMLYRAL